MTLTCIISLKRDLMTDEKQGSEKQGSLFTGGKHPGTTLRPHGHQAIDTRNAAYAQVMREEQGDVLHPSALTEDLGERQATVYEALLERGPHGATNAELANVLGWAVNRITPRVYELRGEGKANPLADAPLVVPLREEGHTGARVKREGPSGAAGQVWVAVAVLPDRDGAPASPKARNQDSNEVPVRVYTPTPRTPAQPFSLRIDL